MRSVLAVVSLLSVAGLVGCIDNDRVRVQSFLPGPNHTFTYSVQTNTVMTPNADGASEAIRRGWLAQTLGAEGMCNGGYVIYSRQLVVPPQRSALAFAAYSPTNANSGVDFGNTGYVVYTGGCL
ncbi:MAG TPA: hypothetical protein VL985_20255 [Stellaceae bacterium]|nr:hypothetical protein [Stellaceae bacterium]